MIHKLYARFQPWVTNFDQTILNGPVQSRSVSPGWNPNYMTHLIVQNTKNGSDFLRICIDCRDFYNVLSTCSRAEGSWFENNILNLGISSLKFECVLFAWNVRINSAGTQRVRTGTGIYAKWSKTDAKEVYFATLKRLILQLEAYSFTVLGHFAKKLFPKSRSSE